MIASGTEVRDMKAQTWAQPRKPLLCSEEGRVTTAQDEEARVIAEVSAT
jgi:hypothetical protein